MIYILTGILCLYILIIILFIFGYIGLKTHKPVKIKPVTKFSICIPFRNEAENLLALLKTLYQLDYPQSMFEILLVDDHSTDDSVQIIADFCHENPDFKLQIFLFNLKDSATSGKKAALEHAIKNARNEWIVTTDADCQIPSQWLIQINNYITTTGKKFVAGPVKLLRTPGYFLNTFQQIDFLSLQGASIGAFGFGKPILCNGANLAFEKETFYRLGSYNSHRQISSGDDVLLMQQFLADDPKQVGYLKTQNAIISTQPQQSWKKLAEQRKRWAAKASQYTDFFSKGISLLVFTANVCLILSLFFIQENVLVTVLIGSKLLVDFILIYKSAQFFKQKNGLWGYVWCCLFYPMFTIYIALSSQLRNFTWKGRELKN